MATISMDIETRGLSVPPPHGTPACPRCSLPQGLGGAPHSSHSPIRDKGRNSRSGIARLWRPLMTACHSCRGSVTPVRPEKGQRKEVGGSAQRSPSLPHPPD